MSAHSNGDAHQIIFLQIFPHTQHFLQKLLTSHKGFTNAKIHTRLLDSRKDFASTERYTTVSDLQERFRFCTMFHATMSDLPSWLDLHTESLSSGTSECCGSGEWQHTDSNDCAHHILTVFSLAIFRLSGGAADESHSGFGQRKSTPDDSFVHFFIVTFVWAYSILLILWRTSSLKASGVLFGITLLLA